MIERIKHINVLKASELPRSEFTLINSVWLALTGLRINGDLDILISTKLRKNMFYDKDENLSFGLSGPLEKRIRIHSANSIYGKLFGVKDVDEVIYKYSIEIEGFRFVEPRFYFKYKRQRFEELLMQTQQFSWWRKWILKERFCNDNLRKIFRKINKDKNDFILLQEYFREKKHFNNEFKNITDEAWGVDIVQSVIVN